MILILYYGMSRSNLNILIQINTTETGNSDVNHFTAQLTFIQTPCPQLHKLIYVIRRKTADHICTRSFNWWLLIQLQLLKQLQGFQSDGTKSGMYDGCFNISKHTYWYVSTKWPAVWGWAFAVPFGSTHWTPPLMVSFNSHTLGTTFNSPFFLLSLPHVRSITFNGNWFILWSWAPALTWSSPGVLVITYFRQPHCGCCL